MSRPTRANPRKKRPAAVTCQCGCGARIPVQPVGRIPKYATEACRQHAWRVRHGKVWGGGAARKDGKAIPPH